MEAPTKRQHLVDLRMRIHACIRCPYATVRYAPIIGTGEYRSPILVIGPSARQRDDKESAVFSGKAQDKLKRMLAKADLDINQVYQTYLVRCYSGRQPKFGEFSAFRRCHSYTVQMMKIMRPTAVVVCGLRVLKWLIIKWTSESLDEHTFYKWSGRALRLREVWGDLKFFVIENPARLVRARNPEGEAKSIELLSQMKSYVVAQQTNEPIALEMTDLKRRGRRRGDQQTFSWS